jgi:hypothetical protein
MLRFLFRLVGMFTLAVAVIMAVLDVTRTIAASRLVVTPLNTSWITVAPDSLEAAQHFVQTRLYPLFWDPFLVAVLNLPGVVVFGVAAFLLYALGRKRRRQGRLTVES